MKTRVRSRSRRPRMTKDDALSFSRPSGKSWAAVAAALEARNRTGCACVPYADDAEGGVFTFARWIALGYCVRKGEKAIRLSTWVPLPGKKPEAVNGEEPQADVRLRPHTVNLFCRCQVDAKPSA